MPFEPGRSGNPGGRTREQRTRERLLSDAIREIGGKNGKLYVDRLHEIALHGEHRDSLKAIVVLLERAFGKAPDYLQVEGAISDPRVQGLLEALRMTPHERRIAAQDTTADEDSAAMDELEHGSDAE
jgi:hypothetical protein